MPVLLRSGRLNHRRGQDVAALIKAIRRVAIVAIVALAYLYYRLFTGPGTLTQIGLLSFTAVAQFAPSIVGVAADGRGVPIVPALSTAALPWLP